MEWMAIGLVVVVGYMLGVLHYGSESVGNSYLETDKA
jgi:hypothetical protein